jgi:hypothetical protein
MSTNALCAVEYEAEATWGVNTSTFATHRVPILDPVDVSGLNQDGIEPLRAVQQMQGGTTPIMGPLGGSFKTRLWLTGHGSTTSGATTLDAMETFKGYAFGNPANSTGVIASAATGTTAAVGSTTTNVVTAASGTFARGSLCRIGTSGLSKDVRGGGQFYPINNHTTTNLLLRHATPTAAANADVVYAAINFWFPELAGNTAVKGLRFRFLTPDQQYECHGCWPMSVTITGTNPAEVPIMEIEWGVTWWQSTSGGTFPSSVTQNQYNPAPVGGGSFIVYDVGSTVATEYSIRAFSVSIQLGIAPLPGVNTVHPRARYVGAVRQPSKIRFSFTYDAEAAGTNTFETKRQAGTSIGWTWSGSTTAGSALGMHAQNCKLDKAVRQVQMNNINSYTVEGYCCAGSDTTTDLSQAALVMAYA